MQRLGDVRHHLKGLPLFLQHFEVYVRQLSVIANCELVLPFSDLIINLFNTGHNGGGTPSTQALVAWQPLHWSHRVVPPISLGCRFRVTKDFKRHRAIRPIVASSWLISAVEMTRPCIIWWAHLSLTDSSPPRQPPARSGARDTQIDAKAVDDFYITAVEIGARGRVLWIVHNDESP